MTYNQELGGMMDETAASSSPPAPGETTQSVPFQLGAGAQEARLRHDRHIEGLLARLGVPLPEGDQPTS